MFLTSYVNQIIYQINVIIKTVDKDKELVPNLEKSCLHLDVCNPSENEVHYL